MRRGESGVRTKGEGMTTEEELGLIDALNSSLNKIKGVEQALWHVGDESTDYEMCHMLAGVLSGCVGAVRDAVPDEWAPQMTRL